MNEKQKKTITGRLTFTASICRSSMQLYVRYKTVEARSNYTRRLGVIKISNYLNGQRSRHGVILFNS